MTGIERRATLKKAPQSDDVVADLVGATPRPQAVAPAAAAPQTALPAVDTSEHVTATPTVAPAIRRGPGRPRSRRRMEPFSSKIEMSLRDQVDEYLASTGESIVDLLDRALRDAIAEIPVD